MTDTVSLATADIIYDAILDGIAKGASDELADQLVRLEIGSVKTDVADKLLLDFLGHATKNQSIAGYMAIIRYWALFFFIGTQKSSSYYPYLFTDYVDMTDDILSFGKDISDYNRPLSAQHQVLMRIIDVGESPHTMMAMERWFRIFGVPKPNDLPGWTRATVNSNGIVYNYLRRWSIQKSAPPPEWVGLGRYERVPYSDEIMAFDSKVFDPDPLPVTIDDWIDDQYMEPIEEGDRPSSPRTDTRLSLREQFLEYNPETQNSELEELGKKRALAQLGNDTDLVRRLGPQNFFWQLSFEDNRTDAWMFLCLRYDMVDTDGLSAGWFTGKCENPDCGLNIHEICDAVRIPVAQGGFRGCFCSWICMEVIMKLNQEDMTRLPWLKEQLMTHGIQARVSRGR